MPEDHELGRHEDVDVVVVGAGFGGMHMLHRLRGDGLSVRVLEAGDDVGGTWYWNRYPGARCDVESVEYSYGFSDELQQDWEWTERYAGQPEILRYAQHVADRFGLRDHIWFETRATTATFDEEHSYWRVGTDRGDELTAQFVVMASGCLSAANLPQIEGIDSFTGEIYHTGRWPHDPVELAGKRVGVVGTGSSGVQLIPIVAERAGHLTVFQRTANYSIPARNRPLRPGELAAVKADYEGFRQRNRQMQGAFGARFPWNTTSALEVDEAARSEEYGWRWEEGGFVFLGAFGDTAINPEANAHAAGFVKARIREVVRDPAVAELLSPKQVIGCKRLCLDTGYFETFNRDNVTLIDISGAPIEAVTPRGLRTGGREYELDVIIFATGFDAMTGAVLRVDVRGRDGATLHDAWSAGPVTYLGLAVPSFPNLFLITGPGSPSVLANMFVAIDQHVTWVADCIGQLRSRGILTIEASPEAAAAWVAHVNGIAELTLYPTCNSWYLGANIPGKTRIFMPLPGFPAYEEKCNEVVANGYEGFLLGEPAAAHA
jgi:cyclohexanone monooxygenase